MKRSLAIFIIIGMCGFIIGFTAMFVMSIHRKNDNIQNVGVTAVTYGNEQETTKEANKTSDEDIENEKVEKNRGYTEYHYSYQAGEPVLSYYIVYEYDIDGIYRRETFYDSDGNIERTIDYSEKENNKDYTAWYNNTGSLEGKTVYLYDENSNVVRTEEYDRDEKMIREEDFIYDGEDYTSTAKTDGKVTTETEKIGNIKKEIAYDADGNVSYVSAREDVSEYNSEGMILADKKYIISFENGDGTYRTDNGEKKELYVYDEYEYDEHGNRTLWIMYPESTTDRHEHRYTNEYDSQDRLKKVILNQDGKITEEIHYEYNN